jgi:hypothetical protein
MKKFLGTLLMLAMVFAFAACGSNATDDNQNNGNSTSELLTERYAFEEGGFSIQPPKDWEAKDIGQKYIAFMDMSHTDFSPNINFVVEEYDGSLKDYVTANIASLKKALDSLKIVNQSDFTTLSGQKGTKLVVTDEQLDLKLQQTFYIFELSKSKKIVIACTNLAEKKSDTDALFEESVSTFKVDK